MEAGVCQPEVMDAGSQISLVVTAAVALVGYWSNQHIKRRELKIQAYTEALQAIHLYEELPYMVRHRKESSAEERAALAGTLSDVFAKVHHHQTLLSMDSPVVGEAYAALFSRTKQQGGPYRREAWNTSPVACDAQMPGAAYYPYDNQAEFDACLLAMRRELSPWGTLVRWRTRRQFTARLAHRPPRWEPEWMRQRREQALTDAT